MLSFLILVAVSMGHGRCVVYLFFFPAFDREIGLLAVSVSFFGFFLLLLLQVWFTWVGLYSFVLVGGVGSMCWGVFMWLCRAGWWVS